MTMTADLTEFAARLAEFVKQVESGHEVLLTQDNKPVAKLVPATEKGNAPGGTPRIRSLKGHRVLTPVISHSELAEEMFDKK